MKIHLVDGTYELFRNYFGAPPKQAPDGREVGATLGLLRSLLMLLTNPEVTYVGCAFDHVIKSFRNDLYSGYKTGEGVDPKLLDQFPLAEEAVAALGVVVWPMVEFEADDALGTATARFKKNKRGQRESFRAANHEYSISVTRSRKPQTGCGSARAQLIGVACRFRIARKTFAGGIHFQPRTDDEARLR